MSTPSPDQAPPAARRKGPLMLAVTGIAVAAAAGFTARALLPGGPRAAAATQAVPVAVASVVRTDVSARQVVTGTLGYAGSFAVADELTAGIVTWLPDAGGVVRRDQALFQVAGQPVFLVYGPVPAWRDFLAGMTPGPDVRELQRNLAVLGLDPGPADGTFGAATEAAVQRWQQRHGLPVTGTIPLGQVAFLPGPLRVTVATAQLGAPVATGSPVLSGTSDIPVVSVALTVGGPAVRKGDQVVVTMPDAKTAVAGTVTSVGQVAGTAGGSGSGSGSGSGTAGQGSGGSSGGNQAVIPVTIGIHVSRIAPGTDQAPVQVAITQQRDSGVLAVPVTALLAQPGGGYAVRVSGAGHRLIPVTTGLFDDATGLVEVSGPGLAAGLSVQVAQG